MQQTHPNTWSFIDSIKNEVHTVHNLVSQINSGMAPREKKSQSKIVERRTAELYSRFNQGKITVEELLHQLSFFVTTKK
jgi:hypothetical protein